MKSWENFILFFIIISSIGCSKEINFVEEGHRLFDQAEYTKSSHFYSKAIDKNPYVVDNYYYRGLARLKNNDYKLAIIDFSQAICLDEKYVNAYINRGSIWKENGEIEKALYDYNKVVNFKPFDLRALEERAELLFIINEFSKAIFDFDRLISNGYNLANTYRQRADIKYYNLDYEGAIKDYSSSIALNPTVAYAYNNLAWLQATCVEIKYRDGEQAVYNAEKAVHINPSRYNLHTLAAAYAEVSLFDRSISILNKIIYQYDEQDDELSLLKDHLAEFKANRPIYQIPVKESGTDHD